MFLVSKVRCGTGITHVIKVISRIYLTQFCFIKLSIGNKTGPHKDHVTFTGSTIQPSLTVRNLGIVLDTEPL